MVVLRALFLGYFLVCLAVQHEGVHGALDLTFFLVARSFGESFFGRTIDKGLDVSNVDVGVVLSSFGKGP